MNRPCTWLLQNGYIRHCLKRSPLTTSFRSYRTGFSPGRNLFINGNSRTTMTGHKVGVSLGVALLGFQIFGNKKTVRCLSNEASSTTAKSGASEATNLLPSAKKENLKKFSKVGFKDLLALAKPERMKIGAGMFFLCISSIVTMAVPFGIGKVIDVVFQDSEGVERLKEASVVIGGIFLLGAAANFGRVYLFNCAAQNIVANLRKRVFSSIMNQETAFFDKTPSGELVNRLSSDCQQVGSILTTNISDGMRSFAQAIVGFAMMGYMSTKLTGVVVSVVPVVGILAIVYGRFVKRLTRQVQDSLADATQIGGERITHIRTVRAFAKEESEINKYFSNVDHIRTLGHKEALARAMFFGTTGFTGNVIMLSVLWYGGHMLQAGEMSVGNLTSFLIYTAYSGMSIVGISSFYSEFMKGIGVSSRVFELIDRKPLIPLHGGHIPDKFLGAITFDKVDFSYESRENLILDSFSLDLPKSTILGIVGKSGTGKSTLASLLYRFYDTESGALLLDGKDIKEYDPSWIRNQIAIVPQDPVLFSGTVGENIRYGKPDCTDEEMFEAARKANAHQFITEFENGYDTKVGERGQSLSGGQRQRVAIARALLKDPRILILDEATSSLDSTSERLIQESLEKYLLVDRTVIIITHRLSILQKANTIAVLRDGKLVEQGNYQELTSNPESDFQKLLAGHEIDDSA